MADEEAPEPQPIISQTVHEVTEERPGMEPVTVTETETHIESPPPPQVVEVVETEETAARMTRMEECLYRIEALLTPPVADEPEVVEIVEEPEPAKPTRRSFKRY